MLKKYFLTILLSSITFAHIYMLATISEGSFKGYIPLILGVSSIVFLLYLVSALPLSLVLNCRKKAFSFIDLICYCIVALVVLQIIDSTFFERLIKMKWSMFKTEDWIMFAVWLGVSFSYWFWNSFITLKNTKNSCSTI